MGTVRVVSLLTYNPKTGQIRSLARGGISLCTAHAAKTAVAFNILCSPRTATASRWRLATTTATMLIRTAAMSWAGVVVDHVIGCRRGHVTQYVGSDSSSDAVSQVHLEPLEGFPGTVGRRSSSCLRCSAACINNHLARSRPAMCPLAIAFPRRVSPAQISVSLLRQPSISPQACFPRRTLDCNPIVDRGQFSGGQLVGAGVIWMSKRLYGGAERFLGVSSRTFVLALLAALAGHLSVTSARNAFH